MIICYWGNYMILDRIEIGTGEVKGWFICKPLMAEISWKENLKVLYCKEEQNPESLLRLVISLTVPC